MNKIVKFLAIPRKKERRCKLLNSGKIPKSDKILWENDRPISHINTVAKYSQQNTSTLKLAAHKVIYIITNLEFISLNVRVFLRKKISVICHTNRMKGKTIDISIDMHTKCW